MKKLIVAFLLSFLFATPALSFDIIPGLKGHGTDTRAAFGGGGSPIYYVVNSLVHDTPGLGESTRNGVTVKTGTLLDCVNDDVDTGKIIMFEVSGTIFADVPPYIYQIDNPYTIIAGQTAPSPGIQLKNIVLSVQTHDVLIQHIVSRPGDLPDGSGYLARDRRGIQAIASAASGDVYNVVFDHVSTEWSTDPNATNWEEGGAQLYDITWANSIIGEGLSESIHPTCCEHSKGIAIQVNTGPIALLDNLFISNVDRNPYVREGSTSLVANNYIYNAIMAPSIVATTDSALNISLISNLNVAGPSSIAAGQAYWFATNDMNLTSHIYAYSNQYNSTTQSSASDWTHVRWWGSMAGQSGSYEPTIKALSAPEGTIPDGWTDRGVANVKTYVLTNAGARPADRDPVDLRLISEANSGGTSGQIVDMVNYTIDDCTGLYTPFDACRGIDSAPSGIRNPEAGWPNYVENTRMITEIGFPVDPNSYSGNYTYAELWLQGLAMDVEGGPPPTNPVDYNNDFSDDPNYIDSWKFEYDFNGAVSNTLTGGNSCVNANGTYQAVWDGEFAGPDTDKINIDSGGTNKDGTVQASVDLHADYAYCGTIGARFDDGAGYILWAITGDDVINDTIGTAWFRIKPLTTSGTTVFLWNSYDANNKMYANWLSDGTVHFYHRGNSTIAQITSSVSISAGTWNLVGLKWSDAGNEIGVKVNDNAWETFSTAVVSFTSASTSLKIGPNSAGFVDTYYVDNLFIKSTYDSDAGPVDTGGGSEPSFAGTGQLEGNYSADFEAGSSNSVSRADADLSAGFPGKNGADGYSFTVFTRFKAESLPANGDAMRLAAKWTGANLSYACGLYNDGGDTKLRMILRDTGAATQTFTHASAISADVEYCGMWSWNNTTNTASIDLASGGLGNWARVGTRIDDVGNDVDSASSTAAFEVGAYEGGTADYYDGLIDETTVLDDVLTAAQFLKVAAGEYGEPEPSGPSAATANATYDTYGQVITITFTFDQNVNIVGVPPYFDCTTDGNDLRFYYASGGGTTSIVFNSVALNPGYRTAAIDFKDATWTISAGCTIKDDQGNEAASMDNPALGGTAEIAIVGTSTYPILLGTTNAYYATFTLWDTATTTVQDDYFQFTDDITDDINTDAAGASGHVITVDGNGKTLTGRITADEEYWVFENMEVHP